MLHTIQNTFSNFLRKKRNVKALFKLKIDGGLRLKKTLNNDRLVCPLFTENGNMHYFICPTSKRILIINSSPKENFFLESDVMGDVELLTKKTKPVTLNRYFNLNNQSKVKGRDRDRGENELNKNVTSVYQHFLSKQLKDYRPIEALENSITINLLKLGFIFCLAFSSINAYSQQKTIAIIKAVSSGFSIESYQENNRTSKVKLEAVNNVCENGYVNLRWHTENEINKGIYFIERKTSLSNGFKIIGQMNYNFAINVAQYNFTDLNPVSYGGKVEYQILKLDTTVNKGTWSFPIKVNMDCLLSYKK